VLWPRSLKAECVPFTSKQDALRYLLCCGDTKMLADVKQEPETVSEARDEVLAADRKAVPIKDLTARELWDMWEQVVYTCQDVYDWERYGNYDGDWSCGDLLERKGAEWTTRHLVSGGLNVDDRFDRKVHASYGDEDGDEDGDDSMNESDDY
jgi:hypothetical protein